MSQETGPKSAYELAMERLKQKDTEAGVERKPVTDAQKAAIAEIRNFYEAKLAELDVLHQGTMQTSLEPEARTPRAIWNTAATASGSRTSATQK